jgi:hypothetical protein
MVLLLLVDAETPSMEKGVKGKTSNESKTTLSRCQIRLIRSDSILSQVCGRIRFEWTCGFQLQGRKASQWTIIDVS